MPSLGRRLEAAAHPSAERKPLPIHQSSARLPGAAGLSTRLCYLSQRYLVNTDVSDSLAGWKVINQPLNLLIGRNICCLCWWHVLPHGSDGCGLVRSQPNWETQVYMFPESYLQPSIKVIMSHLKTFTSVFCDCIIVLEIGYSEHHTCRKTISFSQKLDVDIADLCASQRGK